DEVFLLASNAIPVARRDAQRQHVIWGDPGTAGRRWGRQMLHRTNPKVSDCLHKAQAAHERGAGSSDPEYRDACARIEQSWLQLAESYELADKIEDFLNSAAARR